MEGEHHPTPPQDLCPHPQQNPPTQQEMPKGWERGSAELVTSQPNKAPFLPAIHMPSSPPRFSL